MTEYRQRLVRQQGNRPHRICDIPYIGRLGPPTCYRFSDQLKSVFFFRLHRPIWRRLDTALWEEFQ